jgi:diguanylate cyclase (GGDEF)-like protein
VQQLEIPNRILDRFLYRFSVFVFPLAICLISVVALSTWNSEYPYKTGTLVEFQVASQAEGDLLPQDAATKFSPSDQRLRHKSTHLSEKPIWLRFSLSPSTTGDDVVVEFPSRHTQTLSCWNGNVSGDMGKATRDSVSGQFMRVQAGFALDVGKLESEQTYLCEVISSGPARISIKRWDRSQLDIAATEDRHRSGFLEGSLLMLAAFMLLAAVVNREWMYILFVAWLIANLRLAALSAGWDTQWLSKEVPAAWVHPMRKLTITAYYILTYTLFVRLFTEEMKLIGYSALLRLAQWASLPLIVAAVVLPYGLFLPFMWVAVTLGSLILVFLLVRILWLARSAVANWYAASIAITVVSGLSEVIAAALGSTSALWAGNSVAAAAVSSLMAALAIAAQMREERRERVRAQAELRGTYEALPIGLFTTSFKGDFLQLNPAQKLMLGRMEENGGAGQRWHDYFDDDSWRELRQVADVGGDLEVHGRSGTSLANKTFHIKASVSGDRIEGSMQDVTDRAKATERLEYLAEYDPLTNVLNRRGIEKALTTATADLAEQRPLAIAYLDLDRFKLINDLYGHMTGDEVLREICGRIQAQLGTEHQIGRVGGDEFLVIFHGTGIEKATSVCRRMIGAIEDEPCHIGDKAFQVKGSIGLIEVIDGSIVRDAISIADRACREAKRNPTSLVVYERGARAFRERSDELALIGRFGVAQVPEGLFLDMQPIMSLAAPYDSLNFEVLLRLREPDNSITPAGKVIAAAENNGRISLIDRWVLSTTLKWLAEYRDRLPKTRFVCVNLSGGSLNDEKFIRDAFAMVAEAGSVASLLCFEITESVALHDLGNTSRFIDTVRSYGAKVALDDFGAGYTSFSYLKELAAEAVKIDGAFVRDVNSHPANLAIVEAIAELSHNLGMKTIAEWAEDAATVAVLKEVGVDYVQGYAVAKPMSPERILSADSCAALVEDPQVARLVWDGIGKMETSMGGDVPSGLVLPPLPIRRRH